MLIYKGFFYGLLLLFSIKHSPPWHGRDVSDKYVFFTINYIFAASGFKKPKDYLLFDVLVLWLCGKALPDIKPRKANEDIFTSGIEPDDKQKRVEALPSGKSLNPKPIHRFSVDGRSFSLPVANNEI